MCINMAEAVLKQFEQEFIANPHIMGWYTKTRTIDGKTEEVIVFTVRFSHGTLPNTFHGYPVEFENSGGGISMQ